MKKQTPKQTSKQVPAAKQAEVKKGPIIIPLQDRILVKPFSSSDLSEKNQYGIIIPDTVDKEKPEQGEVLAVGEGKYEDGKLIPVRIKVGDRVLFSKYGFDEVKVEGEELYILKEESILAVIR